MSLYYNSACDITKTVPASSVYKDRTQSNDTLVSTHSSLSLSHTLSSSLSLLLYLSHGLKLVDTLFGVALADLAQGLVFVAACLHVLGVDQVVGRLLALVPGAGKL